MNKKFKEKHFFVIKEAVSKDVASFVYNYFMMKKQVARTFFDTKFISPLQLNGEFGMMNKCQTLILIMLTRLWKLYY